MAEPRIGAVDNLIAWLGCGLGVVDGIAAAEVANIDIAPRWRRWCRACKTRGDEAINDLIKIYHRGLSLTALLFN